MSMQKKLTSLLGRLYDFCTKYQLDTRLKDDIQITIKDIECFQMKVPLLGGFSAGKSSLLNSYLGKGILPTDLGPETAIATELKAGPERIVAHDRQGGCHTYSITDLQQIEVERYRYLELFLDCPQLSEHQGIILVDMPGLDSGIEAHNKALFQYINDGVFFIVVIDCEDGGLKQSVVNRLYELDLYKLSFAVIVNKADKKPPEDVDQIIQSVKSITNQLSGEPILVEKASTRLEDGMDGFNRIISSLDRDKLLVKRFGYRIDEIRSRVLNAMAVQLEGTHLNQFEIDERIIDLERKINEIQLKLKEQETEAKDRVKNKMKAAILSDVRQVLTSNVNTLAESALVGKHAFQERVNELIRPVLVASTNKQLDITYADLATSIAQETKDAERIAGIQNALETTGQAIKGTFETIAAMSNDNRKYEGIYKLATGGLALATGIVAPWIEVIVILLPDILRFLGIGSESSKLEKMKQRIEETAIPQILNRLEAEITPTLEETLKDMINQLRQSAEAKLSDLSGSLNQVKEQKTKESQDYEAYIASLRSDIAQLEAA